MNSLIEIDEKQYWRSLSLLFGNKVSQLFFKKASILRISSDEDAKLLWAIMYKITGKSQILSTAYKNFFSLNPEEEKDYLERIALPNNFISSYNRYSKILEQLSQFIDYKRYSFLISNLIDIEFPYFKESADIPARIDAKLILYINEYTPEEFTLSKQSKKVICNEMHFSSVGSFSHYLEGYINSKYFNLSAYEKNK